MYDTSDHTSLMPYRSPLVKKTRAEQKRSQTLYTPDHDNLMTKIKILAQKKPPEGSFFFENGAGEEIRTLDPNLGKVMLYP
jgi:hypothetical protein